MRVDIQHTQLKTGIFFGKTPGIALTVQFSPEELAIIRDKGIGEYVIHKPPIYSGLPERIQAGIKIKHLTPGKPCFLHYDSKAAAEADDPRIRASLKQLKDIIEQGAPQSGSYEL